VTACSTLLRRIPRGTVVRGVGLIAGATAAGQVLALLLSPVLSRIYTPAAFGLSGVFISLVSILSVVGTLRYELAIPLPKDEPSAVNLLVVGLTANVGIIGLLALCVPALRDPIAVWVGVPALAGYLWLLPPTLLATGAYQLLTYWAVRKRQYTVLAQRNLYFGLAQITTMTGLGLLGLKPVGLLLGTGAGHATGALTVARSILAHDRALLTQASPGGMVRMARRYVRFPLLASWSGLVNSAGSVVPLLLLSKYFGPTVAGWYVLTTRVVGAPSGLIGEAVAQVYLGEVATLARRDPQALRRLFVASFRRLLAVGVLPILLIAAPAPLWFPIVFGERWLEAGLYALVLVPLYLTQFVAVPLSTLNVLEKQHLDLAWDSMRLVLGVASVVVPWYLGASALVTIGVFGSVMASLYVVLLLVNHREICRASAAAGAISNRERELI
jgi:O-antigen/teichoic acid export membrane protein